MAAMYSVTMCKQGLFCDTPLCHDDDDDGFVASSLMVLD